MNAKKTKAMLYREAPTPIKTLEIVHDFKYLGAWIAGSEQDFNIRKAQAWNACNSMTKIWNSKLPRNLKIKLFTTTVESVLTYGAETCTLTAKMRKEALEGCYTRLLRKALDVSWQTHTTNKDIYVNLLPISERLRRRRLNLPAKRKQSPKFSCGNRTMDIRLEDHERTTSSFDQRIQD